MTLAALVMSSCNHKLLEDGEEASRIRVEFDWSDAPEANPQGMCVYFYNAANGTHHRFDLPGMNGGYVELPYGDWHIITYNNDTEGLLFDSDHDFDLHTGYTRDGNILEGALGNGAASAPRAAGTSSERVTITPDMMWGESRRLHNIAETPGGETVVTLRPHELVCIYSYEIRNVKNIDRIIKMCGALTGMSSSISFGDEALGTSSSTLAIPAQKGTNSTITGQFYTFGHHDLNPDPHRMTLYVWLDDGKKLVYGTESQNWNVTEQIHNAADRRHVHYIIDGLDIPDEDSGSWFDPSADDWGTENYDLPIN